MDAAIRRTMRQIGLNINPASSRFPCHAFWAQFRKDVIEPIEPGFGLAHEILGQDEAGADFPGPHFVLIALGKQGDRMVPPLHLQTLA